MPRLVMVTDRRTFITATVVTLTAGSSIAAAETGNVAMYGLIGKMRARPGQRDALVRVLLNGVSDMPGCLSYIVANDPTDADLIWITEAWESDAAHAASLSLPSVRASINEGRPLIAGMEAVAETAPVGGHGLSQAS